MTDAVVLIAPELPVLDVPLAELAHIETVVGRGKLVDVLRGLRSGVELPPIWLSREHAGSPWRLEDGNHRLHAARVLGRPTIRAVVAVGPDQIALGERRWLEGTIGLNETDSRFYAQQLERQRAALERCGLAHLYEEILTNG